MHCTSSVRLSHARRVAGGTTVAGRLAGAVEPGHGNMTLAGLPGNQLDRLQSAMNVVARLVCSALVFRCLPSRTSRASYVVWWTWTQERGCDSR